VGLAAPQVGVNVRMMVYNPTGRRGDEEFILVNPKILNASGRRETAEEGCLSFPKIFADVEVRPGP
jgi:peptide deformylase